VKPEAEKRKKKGKGGVVAFGVGLQLQGKHIVNTVREKRKGTGRWKKETSERKPGF